MAKDTYYFSHDYEPTSDPKIGALLAKYGGLGYGIYWRIVEMLHSTESHQIEKKKYFYATLAQQMLTDVEHVSQIIEYCISDCELFTADGQYFWSERVFRNIAKREETRELKSKAGKASAEKRNTCSTGVQQPSTRVQHNPTKERKGKEIKGKETYRDNIHLLLEENEKLVNEHGQHFTDRCYDFLANYKNEKGYKTKSDYLTILRWVVDAVLKLPDKPIKPKESTKHKCQKDFNNYNEYESYCSEMNITPEKRELAPWELMTKL